MIQLLRSIWRRRSIFSAACVSLEYPCTKIIIAQRVSTTAQADRILILEGGRLIEEGTHAELLAKRGYYYDVFMLQNEGIGRQVTESGQK